MKQPKNNIKAVAIITEDPKGYREALKCVKFTGEQAIATDGFILAKTASNIPAGLKNATPYKKLNGKQELLENGDIKVDYSILTPNSPENDELTYPDHSRIEPEEGANNHLKIGLRISVLEKLVKSAKCTGSSLITFEFNEDNIKVIRAKSGDVEYLIMPYRIND